ncbi:MAG: hypothetical protein R2734_11660 [Nocardioides sp.]
MPAAADPGAVRRRRSSARATSAAPPHLDVVLADRVAAAGLGLTG